jgi:tetratricopeptide (TPR) repeat protein
MDANHAAMILIVVAIVILLLIRGRRSGTRSTSSTRTWTFTIGKPVSEQFGMTNLSGQVNPADPSSMITSESIPAQVQVKAAGLTVDGGHIKESFGLKLLEQLALPKALAQDLEVQKLFAEGFAFMQQKDFAQAIAIFRKAVTLAHHNLYLQHANENIQNKVAAMAHHNLATALLAKGDVDAGIIEFHEGLRLSKDMAALHDGLGNALLAKGDQASAASEFQEAARLDPNLAMLHNNFGQSLAAKGDLESAMNEYRKALNLNPELAIAQENLRRAKAAKGGLPTLGAT